MRKNSWDATPDEQVQSLRQRVGRLEHHLAIDAGKMKENEHILFYLKTVFKCGTNQELITLLGELAIKKRLTKRKPKTG